MNQLKKMAAAFALTAGSLTLVAAAPAPAELSASELGAVQSKSYALPASTVFNATVATLHTLGYVDINASKDSGTISGTTEAKAKTFYNIFWGFGKKKLTQKASVLVEENGSAGALVRLNLHVNETKARGIWGTSFSDGKLVRVAPPYQEFFTALDAETARRSPQIPASTAPVPTPVTVVPAAPIGN